MADLLKLHLFQAKQWREAEKTLLHWDRTLSDFSKELCPAESVCSPIIRFFTETLSLQIAFGIVLAALTWKASQHLHKKLQIKLFLFLFGFFVVGDFISNQLRYVFQRMRPDHAEYLLDMGGKGDFLPSFSFPSNHAFNLFALSAIFYLLRKKDYLRGVNFPMALFAVATLVAISRVLVWRHYPLDIVAGMLFGSLYACTFAALIMKFVHAPQRTDKL
jgi:membrane-associated phospholipid phosphatase